MIPDQVYSLLVESIRVLFLLGLPVVVIGLVAGALSSVLQGVTQIPEPAISYALKVVALVAVGFFFLSDFGSGLIDLFEQGFK